MGQSRVVKTRVVRQQDCRQQPKIGTFSFLTYRNFNVFSLRIRVVLCANAPLIMYINHVKYPEEIRMVLCANDPLIE